MSEPSHNARAAAPQRRGAVVDRAWPRVLLAAGAIFGTEALVVFVLQGVEGLAPLARAAIDATLLLLLIAPMLYVVILRPFFEAIRRHEAAEEALEASRVTLEQKVVVQTAELRAINERLGGTVSELERRVEDARQLSQLTEMLQTSNTAAEAYPVVADHVRALFPGLSGALSMMSSSRNYLERVAVWGERPACDELYGPDACWAIRRGRPHLSHVGDRGTVCAHATDEGTQVHLCLPLVAQGESIGALHLVCPPGMPHWTHRSGDEPLSRDEQLAGQLADQVALGLANLRLRETLRQQSIRDPLTGLFNRRYMEEFVDLELPRAARRGAPVGIVMLDIDHFKQFNDRHGHAAGDAVLREVGWILQQCTRESDLACRFGGEEFALILPEAPLDAARQRCEEIRQRVQRLNVSHMHGELGGITISMGVAVFPDHGNTPQALLNAADAALYDAKSAGRNRVVVAAYAFDAPAAGQATA